MAVFYVALIVAVLIVLAALIAFAWAVRGGQFDDLETPAHRILFEDDANDSF